ncbi:50S ribosomal protein L4 [Patescibacteria group bacterium]|nr:50S ribosomal protein L4 [Patescibacteria group bacterium]
MPKVKIYNSQGKPAGEVNLEPKIFNVKIKPELVQQAVRTQLANKRVAIAHTKDRSEVRGGGRKPWRQKGTGRARHGSTRSPIWSGGGVTFGPRNNRNFTLKINKKAKRQALFMVLSDKVKNKKFIVLEGLTLSAIKTKEIAKIISALPVKKSILMLLPKSDNKIIKSAKNIPYLKTINADSLNVYDIMVHEFTVCTKDCLAVINKTYLK